MESAEDYDGGDSAGDGAGGNPSAIARICVRRVAVDSPAQAQQNVLQ
jgi:hypothetical protein